MKPWIKSAMHSKNVKLKTSDEKLFVDEIRETSNVAPDSDLGGLESMEEGRVTEKGLHTRG